MSEAGAEGLVERLRDERHCNDWYLRQEAAATLEAQGRALAEAGWRPIETAPKDGSTFLAFVRDRVCAIKWCAAWEIWFDDSVDFDTVDYENDEMFGIGALLPTRWMPLPDHPGISGRNLADAIPKKSPSSQDQEIAGLREELRRKEAALREIAKHPEKSDKGVVSYAVGWAFWNVQNIARSALSPLDGEA